MAKEPGELVETGAGDIPDMVAGVKAFFGTNKTKDVSFRKQQLRNVLKLMEENKDRITDALMADLHKNESEAILMEFGAVKNDTIYFLNNLDELAGPQPHPKDLLNKFNSVYVQPEPYGVVLIIAPWNYPFSLVFQPLVGAIAAGNSVVVKPSESSVATSNLIRELIPQYLDSSCCAVITGGVEVSKAILQERFDYIFYTGSTNVGKIVMKQAAENITPVTLELGGKSPALVAPDANIDVAARRIVWGKLLNAGQTCIAPDYVLCPSDKKERFIECCKKTIVEFYGEDPQQSKDFGRIVNSMHYKRLVGLMKSGGTIAYGGKSDETSRYISPTLITDVTTEDRIMKEEVFGPLLPMVWVDDVEQAIKIINDREKPLAFYVFTESKSTFEYINRCTSAGGVVHNDTLMHGAVPSFPFGGVGHSGMGAYHGDQTFKTFSHYKPVLSVGTGLEALNKMRYPPFSIAKVNRLTWLLGAREKSNFPWRLLCFFFLVAIVAVIVQTYGIPSWIYRFLGK